MIKVDWNKEFVKYIRRLQKTPKYRGFTYPCLASVKKIKKEFQERKQAYLEMVSRREAAGAAAVTIAAAAAAGGGRRKKSHTRRKRTKRRPRHTKRGGRSTESEGLPAAPDPLPWKDQLVDTQF